MTTQEFQSKTEPALATAAEMEASLRPQIAELQAKLEKAEALNAVGAIDAPPAHYDGKGIDVFAVIDAFGLDFYEGNCIKYILRHRKKHGMNDLLKARHYLDEVIARHGV